MSKDITLDYRQHERFGVHHCHPTSSCVLLLHHLTKGVPEAVAVTVTDLVTVPMSLVQFPFA